MSVYEITDEVIQKIERNEAVRVTATGQESPDYMSLKGNKELANVYEALQSPGSNDDQSQGGDQSVEYQNLAFNADFSGELQC